MTGDLKRWRGLTALIGAAVEQGASAIERVHLGTAQRPFKILEQIPGVAKPAAIVDAIHTGATAGVYETVRVITRAVTKTVDAVLLVVEASVEDDPQHDHDPDREAAAHAGGTPR